jgi:hypothetical protein
MSGNSSSPAGVNAYTGPSSVTLRTTTPAASSSLRRFDTMAGEHVGTPRRISLKRVLPLKSSRRISGVQRWQRTSVALDRPPFSPKFDPVESGLLRGRALRRRSPSWVSPSDRRGQTVPIFPERQSGAPPFTRRTGPLQQRWRSRVIEHLAEGYPSSWPIRGLLADERPRSRGSSPLG